MFYIYTHKYTNITFLIDFCFSNVFSYKNLGSFLMLGMVSMVLSWIQQLSLSMQIRVPLLQLQRYTVIMVIIVVHNHYIWVGMLTASLPCQLYIFLQYYESQLPVARFSCQIQLESYESCFQSAFCLQLYGISFHL